ncbi:MAG: MBL fold metallo-hydrolase [Gammaproteobacteria bacterium]|jgi:endoribonuclease LACTB2|nr:MBL fold metallo-hydrolase [Gammaproteobacteria bacterium]
MSKIRFASTVILSRGADNDPEVFLTKRAPELKFFGGYWVFPGGNLNKNLDYLDENDSLDLALVRCAVREILEEIDILSSTLGKTFSKEEKQNLKTNLKDSPQKWTEFLAAFGADFDYVNPVFRITTPPFVPTRFDTQFMHVRLIGDETPEIDDYELVDGSFMKPQAAVDAWESGDMDIAPPVLFLLRILAEHSLSSFMSHAIEETRQLDNGRLHRVYFSPGIFMAPLLTPTLPPATTTNTLIVGTKKLFIIDPATPDESEQARLFEKMDAMIGEGSTFEAILLTHHHIDHVGAVNAVSQRYQIPVRAHEECYKRIESGYIKGQPLQDGDQIDLGIALDGSSDWHLTVVHTPGHAVDHLCYLDSRYHAAIVGDMLSTISTILIDPPEGHMQTYLDSLHKLLTYPIKTLYPAHGPANRDGAALIRQYLQHRKEREKAVIDALTSEAQSIDELLPKIYDDVPEAVYPVASRSLLAGLIKLEEEAICKKSQQGWLLK